jgi:hypothetical protein
MDITSKGILPLDPLPRAVAADSAAVVYTTPAAHRYQLGGLGLLEYVRAKLRVAVRFDQVPTQGEAVVTLSDGTADIASVDVDMTGGDQDFALDIDLGQVSASALLRVVAEVTSAADAGRTMQVAGCIEVETPLISSSC